MGKALTTKDIANYIRFWLITYWPYYASALVVLFFCNSLPLFKNVPELISKLCSSAISVCSTMLGFILTIMTLLSTIKTATMDAIKLHGKYKSVIAYMKQAIQWNVLALSASMLEPFLFSIAWTNSGVLLIQCVLILAIAVSWFKSIQFSYIFTIIMH